MPLAGTSARTATTSGNYSLDGLIGRSMAEQPFTISDVERVLKSLFPGSGDDPFGRLQDSLLKIREEQLSFETGYEVDQQELFTELASIKTRTFGILALQIFNIVKTLMGFLPAGRFILITIAALGLLTTFIQTGSVTSGDIQAAVARSGLGEFVREQLRKISQVANEQAERIETVIELGQDVIESSAIKAGAVVADVDSILEEIDLGEIDPETLLVNIRFVLVETADQAAQLLNLTSNMDTLIFGALRRVPEQIRDIPAQAAALLE